MQGTRANHYSSYIRVIKSYEKKDVCKIRRSISIQACFHETSRNRALYRSWVKSRFRWLLSNISINNRSWSKQPLNPARNVLRFTNRSSRAELEIPVSNWHEGNCTSLLLLPPRSSHLSFHCCFSLPKKRSSVYENSIKCTRSKQRDTGWRSNRSTFGKELPLPRKCRGKSTR